MTVREDGTISLPLVRPMNVRGMTIAQVEDMVRRTYTVDQQILETGHERILVSLQKPRTFKVTVLRQEGSNSVLTATSGSGAGEGESGVTVARREPDRGCQRRGQSAQLDSGSRR